MSNAEFDRFAGTYKDLHAQNIALSGEAPEYFADYKMRDYARAVTRSGADPAGRHLDFGCGVGASLLPFRQHLPRAHWLGADVSGDSLQRVHSAAPDAETVLLTQDGSLPLPAGSLDGGFANCVFHHIPHAEHERVLQDIRRALRPGAPFMVYEHNPLNPLTVRAVNTCPLDENAVLIGAREMLRRCTQAGFSQARIEYRVFFPAALRRLRGLEDRLRAVPLGAQYAVHAVA